MEHTSSKTSKPCLHQQRDFKQEIEDSIRRCEELLSMAPMAYHPPEALKSSGRKSSRSTASVTRSDGRSDVETISSSMVSDRKSAEVDPEWKKNMGLLMNRQDGGDPHVSLRTTPPGARDQETVYASAESSHQELGKQLPVEEYNFSFDDSRNSSCRDEENVESICIRTRTVLHGTDEPGYSGSDDWAYELLGQASTPSTKTSHSELTSKADHESERRAFNVPLELLELEAFDVYERYPEGLLEEQVEQQQQPEVVVAELEGVCADAFFSHRSADGENLHVRNPWNGDGDSQLMRTSAGLERSATFPHSARLSRSSHPGRSPGGSVPKSPPASPKPSGSNRVSAANKSGRINDNAMSFSFTIPGQPKYAEDWEWLEEYEGVNPKFQGEVVQQPPNATEIVLENGRIRIGPAQAIRSDLKRFKVYLL